MIKKRPIGKKDFAEENARYRSHLADTLIDVAQSSTYNKTKGCFVDRFGDQVKPEKVLKEQNEISKLITNISPKDHEWNQGTRQYEPKPALMEAEPKIHSPAYRRKYPDRYKKGYVKWYDRNKPERIVTPAKSGNVVTKQSKPVEIKTSTLLNDLETLQQMRVDDEKRAEKFRRDIQPQFDDDVGKGVGALFTIKKKDFSNV